MATKWQDAIKSKGLTSAVLESSPESMDALIDTFTELLEVAEKEVLIVAFSISFIIMYVE